MSYDSANPFVVADASPEVRAGFYRRTYGLVAAGLAVWTALLALWFSLGVHVPLTQLMLGGRYSWLIVMLLFMGVRWVGDSMAFSTSSRSVQYSGYALTVVAYSVLFVPLITVALILCKGDAGDLFTQVLIPAGITTTALVVGLTATVFMTRVDFSFLKSVVCIGSFVLLGVIIAAACFDVTFGFWMIAAFVAFMGICILYKTHQIKNELAPDQHVGAATVLFAAFMTLLWYVIQLFMSRRD